MEESGQASSFHAAFNSIRHNETCHWYLDYSHVITVQFPMYLSHTLPTLIHRLTGSTELNTSASHKTALEHFEMNTNDAYVTNTAEIETTGNVAYMTTGDAISATQNVAYGRVPPGTDDCYDYVV